MPCRRFEDFAYRTRKSWSRARRVVGKAEILDKGQNPRFVVTNLPAEGLPGEPQERLAAPALYEKLYCARGEMENRIKEAQQDLFADRTSTGWMASNQLRLWFSAFAHLMVSVLRAQVLRGHRSGQRYLGPDPAQAFQDRCPHQDQLPTHSSGVSQRLSLPGNFPARLGQSLRDAGRLNFQRATCRHRKSELTSSSQRTLPKTLILQATKPRRAPPWLSPKAHKPKKSRSHGIHGLRNLPRNVKRNRV